MTSIEELIAKHCPDGVEFKPLGELVYSINTGLNPRKNFKLNTEDAKNYYVTVKEFTSGKIIFSDKTSKINNEALTIIQKRSKLEKDDILLSGIGTVGRVAIVDIDISNWNCSESVYLLKPIQNIILPKYLKHYLTSNYSQDYINSNLRGTTLQGIRQEDLKNLLVGVPPLAVQQEIVRILDTFSSLTAELTAELKLRKKQYEYYRDQLLTFGSNVPRVKLSDVCLTVKKIKWDKTDHSFKYIDLSSVDRDVSKIVNSTLINKDNAPSRAQQIVLENDVLLGTTRPLLKRYCIISNDYNEQICSTGFCVLRADTTKVLPKWLYFQISNSEFFKYVDEYQKGASYPLISDKDVKNYAIPLPPLNVQQQIVSVLDKFDTYCNDLTLGLPKEIELRKKQYEYYRDKLLAFSAKS